MEKWGKVKDAFEEGGEMEVYIKKQRKCRKESKKKHRWE